MKISFKKLVDHAETPSQAKKGDAAYDLTAVDHAYNPEYGFHEYGTGLAVAIPEGYVGLIYPRSSLSKKPLILCNHVGVIDSGYRGEIMLRFKPTQLGLNDDDIYAPGDKIGGVGNIITKIDIYRGPTPGEELIGSITMMNQGPVNGCTPPDGAFVYELPGGGVDYLFLTRYFFDNGVEDAGSSYEVQANAT